MLNSLDTLIGFVTVILTFSLLVTALTQFVLSAINLRGRNLRDGLIPLLRQVAPGLDEWQARRLATEVLRHPMVSLERSWWSVLESACDLELRSGITGIFVNRGRPSCRLGTVVERDELVRILLDLLATMDPAKDPRGMYAALAATLPIEPPSAAPQAASQLVGPSSAAVQAASSPINSRTAATPAVALKAAEVLKDFRAETVRAEMAQPEVANHARVSEALQRTVGHVWPDFLARVHLWFDQTMDRTTARFVGRTRLITWTLSVLLAAVLQLDAFRIYNKISTDQTARSFFAGRGMAIADDGLNVLLDSTSTSVDSDLARLGDTAREFKELTLQGVITLPKWFGRDSTREPGRRAAPSLVERLKTFGDGMWLALASGLRSAFTPGVIATWILLSFGAPFWFQVLRELVKLRPILAGKEETQRRSRQAAPPSLPAASGTSASAAGAAPAGGTGEAGNFDPPDGAG